MEGDDNDDLWPMQVFVMVLQGLQLKRSAPESTEPDEDKTLRLLEVHPIRTFEAMYISKNTDLFRDHFRMDPAEFDALFCLCAPCLPRELSTCLTCSM